MSTGSKDFEIPEAGSLLGQFSGETENLLEATDSYDGREKEIIRSRILSFSRMTKSYPNHADDMISYTQLSALTGHDILTKIQLFFASVSRLARYAVQGHLDDLEEAIVTRARMLTLDLDDWMSAARDEMWLCLLLSLKFQRNTRDLYTLHQAIVFGRSSITRGVLWPEGVGQTVTCLLLRFTHTRSEDDLNLGMNILIGVRKATPTYEDLQPKDPVLESNVREMKFRLAQYLTKKRVIWDNLDQKATILVAEEIVLLIEESLVDPLDEDTNGSRQLYLASALYWQFCNRRQFPDVDRAIAILDERIQTAALSSQRVPADWKASKGYFFLQRFHVSRDVADLDQSINALRDALQSPGIEEDRETYFWINSQLYESTWSRFMEKKAPEDMAAFVSIGIELLSADPPPHSVSGSRLFQIAYYMAHPASFHAPHHDAALFAFRKALTHLPSAFLLGKQPHLEQLPDAAMVDTGMNGGAFAIRQGRPDIAVELIEQGRSLAWSQSLQWRAELDDLERQHPELSRQLKLARAELEEADRRFSEEITPGRLEWSKVNREDLEEKTRNWNQSLSDVRKLSSYEDFLKTPQYNNLRHVSEQGPVILLNMSGFTCAALILANTTLDRPQVVPLSRDLWQLIYAWSEDLQQAMRLLGSQEITVRGFERNWLNPILRGLEKEIVRPVASVLRTLSPYARRIWWCPTNRLTMLPLHLATMRATRYIPSYTTTLASLLRARTARRRTGPLKMLAMACADVPGSGYPPLAGTTAELRAIQSVAPDNVLTMYEDINATTAHVLETLPKVNWLHLAAHGVQRHDAPYESFFLLRDKPLSLGALIALRLPHAELAFLSACHTAAGVPALANEAMHLAAGMVFAGFRGAVATMWEVDDTIGTRLVEAFYKRMFEHDGETSLENAAEAVHSTIMDLKKAGVPVSLLAPFIHIGV